ncbi:MAG TPA: hypothetical protein VMT35_18565 [Ignavibacteriaceae bacterium]|nr:hypothetical protein [Ignavibacteriaceae bacterium]
MKEKEIISPYENFFESKITLDKQNTEIKKVFKLRLENNSDSLNEKNSEEWLQEYFIIYNSYKHER